jgi:hypothetical protein
VFEIAAQIGRPSENKSARLSSNSSSERFSFSRSRENYSKSGQEEYHHLEVWYWGLADFFLPGASF